MTRTRLIETEVENLLKEKITTYSNQAPEDAVYPYAVIELDRANADIVNTYTLEVNVWDENKTHSRANTLMDEIEDILDRTLVNREHYTLVIHCDNVRGTVDDEDKTIKRVRALFILQYAEGSK